MTHIPSRQFWSDPATAILYTRIGGEDWVQVEPSQLVPTPPNVCFVTALSHPQLT